MEIIHTKGGYVFHPCLSICLFVFKQDYAKPAEPISMKCCGGVGHDPRQFKLESA